MKILIAFLMAYGLMATEAYAAQAICVAKARAPHTKSRVVNYGINRHDGFRRALKRTCRQALRECRSKARRPRNCRTIRAIVKFPGLEDRYGFGGGRGGRGWN